MLTVRQDGQFDKISDFNTADNCSFDISLIHDHGCSVPLTKWSTKVCPILKLIFHWMTMKAQTSHIFPVIETSNQKTFLYAVLVFFQRGWHEGNSAQMICQPVRALKASCWKSPLSTWYAEKNLCVCVQHKKWFNVKFLLRLNLHQLITNKHHSVDL